MLNLPRIADEGPHWQSAGATSAPLAPLPPMGLAPLPADFDQVMQMQVGSEREQVSVPRDEGRSSCVYAHRRDMEEVAVRMTNEPSAGRAPPPRPRAPPVLPPRPAGRRAPPSSTPRRSLLARSGDFLMSLLGGDDPSAAYAEQPTTTPPVPASSPVRIPRTSTIPAGAPPVPVPPPPRSGGGARPAPRRPRRPADAMAV